ncbi:HAD-IC family P-type ATPase [Pelagicoccus sp. SDUM812003]|uniref:HAD-IC family P-type ATPase n=1 Tax=Pelagicoccus sp. SDUM812003 TaxID=3041267 RepID=UPI0028100219|nr:HAD-IC family P-type ATPase [Pelagicoccus sp. SDUM812003]MDQ8203618.1 heavy metal translocating P-type ATPase metal-binding domain-containing protein [Pelagicoccus sp. SDUM812003]
MPLERELGQAKQGQVACQHCGTRFHPVDPGETFCCAGCEYVYRIIKDESLDRFYELRGEVSQPVGASVFGNADYNWLVPLIEAAEARGELASLSLALEGVSCVGCVWLVDHLFSDLQGGVSCRVNVQYGTFDLEWRSGKCDVLGFVRRLKQFGYRVCPVRQSRESESKQVVWKLGLAGAFALNGMLYTLPAYLGMEPGFVVAMHFNWLSAFFATLSLVFCGTYFIGRAVRAALQGIAHLDLPISLGIVFAYFVSWYGMHQKNDALVYFDFVCTFVFLMLVGRWLQVVAIERNRNRLADIMLEAPEVEVEASSGARVKASADQLGTGDRYWLGSGQRVPVRSRLLSARASLGMDWISGETESKLVETGGEAPSGAALENQFSVKLEAREPWDASLLARLSRRSARSRERDEIAQRWIFRYLLAAFALAVGGGAFWWRFSGLGDGLKVFISILVVSCPCALGIAWPFADEIALARLKRSGVFVTTHSLWNRISRIRRIVFDKTGTLTRSALTLLNPSCLDSLNPAALEALSALCSLSRHPVASTIRECLMAKGRFVDSTAEQQVDEQIGQGLEWSNGAQIWRLGRTAWALSKEESDRTGTVLSLNGKLVVELLFEDQPLPDSLRELRALKSKGFALSILSGDRQSKAVKIGRMLGLSESDVFGEMRPEEKASWLQTHEPHECLMVGDGANDTLAFELAACCGAPANEQGIVAERADFHYLGSGIQGIRLVVEMAKRRRSAVLALMAFALAYNVFAIGLSLAGWVTPLIAAVLMPLSSIASLGIVWAAMGVARR